MLDELRDQLVAEGMTALTTGPGVVCFTGNDEADSLLNDLDGHPLVRMRLRIRQPTPVYRTAACLARRWTSAGQVLRENLLGRASSSRHGEHASSHRH